MPRGRPPTFPAEIMSAKVRAQALAEADERLSAAREQFAHAALRCLRQQPDAADQVHLAIGLVDQARTFLAKIDVGIDA